MSETLRFDGPSDYLVPEPDVDPELAVIRGGTFTTDRAEEHLTSPHYRCSRVAAGLEKRTRARLEELAVEVGIENPKSFPNKPALAAAIEQAEHSAHDEPAADGEGQTESTADGE